MGGQTLLIVPRIISSRELQQSNLALLSAGSCSRLEGTILLPYFLILFLF